MNENKVHGNDDKQNLELNQQELVEDLKNSLSTLLKILLIVK